MISKDELKAALEQHFAVGNIILSSYWRMHDEVLGFDWDNGSWSVRVQRVVNKNGSWKRVESPRNHCTHPDTQDRVVDSLIAA